MKINPSRKVKQAESWPKIIQPGRAIVRVYRRRTPSGNYSFMVSNYADGDRRRFDSYKTEEDAVKAAETLAKRIDSRDYVAASMTRDQAIEYANSVSRLKPFGVTVDAATATVAECLKMVGDLSSVQAAVKFYASRHKQITKKPVPDMVVEFLKIKEARDASQRYMKDLHSRLDRFAEDCKKDAGNVTTADVQDWLDGLKLKPRNYTNFRIVLHTLFEFAVARGYAVDNPLANVERVKVNGGSLEIYTPSEIARLLDAAKRISPDFLPCIAIGAFAGLRSAEIERLEWSDIHLADKFITVGADKAKTATRRIVPVADNLAAWLAPYAERRGKVWPHDSVLFYKQQPAVAAATAVKADPEKNIPAQKAVRWKQNALRHSCASYLFALTHDAGRVAGILGNSAVVVHRHYRELVTAQTAQQWFNVLPEATVNVLPPVPATNQLTNTP